MTKHDQVVLNFGMIANAESLNFHHLRYFWAVAKDGNLTRTAQRLHVAQSALSAQIKQLEDELGQALFVREGRRLVLTEAGSIVLRYADDIFAAGSELLSTMQVGRTGRDLLRVGAVATLSRNFQRLFLRPLLTQKSMQLRLTSGGLDELLHQLDAHQLDVVLSNSPASTQGTTTFRSRLLARQPVSIAGSRPEPEFRYPASLNGRSVILPGPGSDLRWQFLSECERLGVHIRIVAEVDDMATMRLLARECDALTLVPSVVVRDELYQQLIHELCVVDDVSESFYAITAERRFQHPLLAELLERDHHALLMIPSRQVAHPDAA